jgi:PAS domain S-box-containing protein
VIFFDQAGTVVDSNDVFLRMTGYTRADIVAGTLTWRRMTPPEWVEASEAEMAAFPRIGGPAYEKSTCSRTGRARWMLFAGRDLGDGTVAEHCIRQSAAASRPRRACARARSASAPSPRTWPARSGSSTRTRSASNTSAPPSRRCGARVATRSWLISAAGQPSSTPRTESERRGACPSCSLARPFSRSYRIIRPSDGAVRHILDTGFPIRDAAGKGAPHRRDRAGHHRGRQVEQRLRDSEARQRVLIEACCHGSLTWRMAFGDNSGDCGRRFPLTG